MKNDLRIGVIGVGNRGELARHAHCPNKGSRLVAGVDLDEKALAAFKEFCQDDKIFIGNNYKELLARKDIDAVFVCSPDFCHEEHALAALNAGKAVYLEKPIAITVAGCERILRTAQRNKVKLYVGHNMRHMDFVLRMKKLLDEGVIGNLQAVWCRHFISYGGDAYFKDWHSEQKNTCGLLLQKGAHDIDVIHWLAGAFTERVIGMGKLSVYNRCKNRRKIGEKGVAEWSALNWPPLTQKNISPKIDVEDHNMLLMQLANGVQATYLQCHYTPDSCRNYTFIGDAGRLENYGQNRIDVYTTRGPFGQPDVSYHLRENVGGHLGADPRIVKEFVDFVKGKKTKPTTCPLAARAAVITGILGTYSMRHGNKPMTIPKVNKDLIKYYAGEKK